MAEGLTIDIAIAASFTAVVSFVLVRGAIGARMAACLAALRAAIPLAYFSWFYDGTWTFLDDLTYTQSAEAVYAAGYGPLDCLFEESGRELLRELSLGRHILYTWWNVLAASLFGGSYHAAVFMNVALTFAVARMLIALAARIGADPRTARLWAIAFLLHPEVVVWSSFINLKDFVVMGLTVAALLSICSIEARRGIASWATLAASMWALTYIRYYITALICVAWACSLLIVRGGYCKLLAVSLGAACYYYLVPWGSEDLDMLRIGEVAYGAIHVLLTPQPWNVDPEFGYLVLPSAFHWLLIAPLCLGAARTWRDFPRARILLVYFATICLFYGSVPELQGPRHRLQVAFIACWFQLCGLYGARMRASWSGVFLTRRAWEAA